MEQRRSSRVPVDTRLMLAIPGFGLAQVRACNVSADGVCVQIAFPAVTTGMLVQVVYVVRHDAGVMHRHVRALVKHVSAGCCGIMFTSLNLATFEIIGEMKSGGGRTPAVSPRRGRQSG